MATVATASVREPDRYHAPALTGLVDLLSRPVRARPHARALVVGAERVELSYAALASLADNLARRLTAAGVRPGDPVGLVAANTVEYVVSLLGAARAGAVVAPLDPALTAGQLAARLKMFGARVVLCGPEAPAGVPAWPVRVSVASGAPCMVTLDTTRAPLGLYGTPAPGLAPDDALILSTAGTTDRARLVPLTHGNVAAAVRALCATYELGPRDATVAVMPLFHTHGLVAALLATLAGGGCVLLPAGGVSRRTRSGMTCGRWGPPGSPRCPQSTRSSSTARRSNISRRSCRRCDSPAVPALRSTPRPSGLLSARSGCRCCRRTA